MRNKRELYEYVSQKEDFMILMTNEEKQKLKDVNKVVWEGEYMI